MIAPAEVPPELENLRRVRSVPIVLVAVPRPARGLDARPRARDVGPPPARRLRGAALAGLHPAHDLRGRGSTHSTAVGLVGLLIGIPLGLALGRLAWAWVADEVPLVYVSPIALVAIALTMPAALLVANLVAALPGRRAARLAPATVLRTE